MKYWFIIPGPLQQDVSLALYERIRPYGANLTDLISQSYVHGDADEEWIVKAIENELVLAGLDYKRG